jgi:hypothetical protein
MKKILKVRLALNRETVRVLTGPELEAAPGANPSLQFTCVSCVNASCASCYVSCGGTCQISCFNLC